MTQPSPAQVAAEKARALLDVGRNADAGKAALEGLQSDPNNADLLGLLAAALDADGRTSDARSWAERSLAVDPQQAWVHNIRARTILNGAGRPQEAVESAYAAVQLNQSNDAYRYTLARAYLHARNRAAAQTVAQSIRGVDPNSALGPLAEALVELDRARFLRINPIWAIVAVIVTRGLALVVWVIVWLVLVALRTGPLRRADGHLLEALQLDPGNPHTHAIAAEVAQSRFRYVQAVDATLATASIDSGLVDADQLAGRIVSRTAVAAVAAWLFWMVWIPFLPYTAPVVAGAVGIVVGLASIAAVAWLDRVQVKRLPAGLVRRVRHRWGLPATATVIAAAVAVVGANSVHASIGVAVAAFVCAAAVAVCAVALIAKLVAARRA